MGKGKDLKATVLISGGVEKGFDESVKTAGDRLQKLSDAAGKTQGAMKKAEGGFTVVKGALAHLAADGIEKAIGALKNLAGSVVETGLSFSSSMSEVQAISGATGSELETLEKTAREYGATTVFSASESADALKYMALAGWDTEKSTSALGGVLNLAAASGMELASASDMVTDYMSAFSMEADQAAYFADVLAYSQANSNTSAEQLGEAFKNSAANMNAAGQDFETTTSLLAMMANQGFKGSEAGTALTAVMRDMTAQMKKGAISIGDTSVQVMDASGNYRDMTDILLDVEKATDGMGDAERAMALKSTFTSDSIKGLNLMLNAGIENAADFEEQLRKSGGSAGEMADTMNDNLQGDLKTMQSGFEELQLKIYDGMEEPLRSAAAVVINDVLPKLQKLAETGAPIFGKIATSVAKALSTGIDFAEKGLGFIGDKIECLIPIASGLTAAFVAYKAITIATTTWEAMKAAAFVTSTGATSAAAVATWALSGALTALNIPLLLTIAGIAGIVAAGVWLYRNWDTVKEKAAQLGEFLSGVWSSIKEKVTAFITAIKNAFITGFGALVGIVMKPFNTILSLVDKVKGSVGRLWDKITGAKKDAASINVPAYATGGFTDGISIAGEAGTEAIISFDPAYRSQNLSYWAKAGQMLGADTEGFTLSESGSETNVTDVGGITFAPNITVEGNADKNDIIQAIRESYPEFLDLLKEVLNGEGDFVYG